jgi:hypothetical protein
MKVLSTSVPIFASDFEAAIERPSPTPVGTQLIVRDVEGVVFELVEPHSSE